MFRRALLASALTTALTAGALAALPTASASTPRPNGALSTAVQDAATHRLSIEGWAIDPAHPSLPTTVSLYNGLGQLVARVPANLPSPYVDAAFGLVGPHRFTATVTVPRAMYFVTVHVPGLAYAVAARGVTQLASTRTRVISVAASYVGHARYAYGGSNPTTGFDCSGYTQWVFAQARALALPRTAEGQRRASHLVPAAAARPGDLVFYLSGGSAYHVAIYAGNHMQYAAATPQDGIRYQAVWSSAVQYGSLLP